MRLMSASECEVAAMMAQNDFLRNMLLFKGIICIVGVILSVSVVYFVGIKWLTHPTAKVLYVNHVVWVIECPLTYAFVYIYDYYRLSQTHSNPCDYMISTQFSLLTRVPCIIGITAQMVSMFMIAVERVMSTYMPSSYEKIKYDTIGAPIAWLSSIITICYTVTMLMVNVDWDRMLSTYTSRTPDNADRYQAMTNIQVGIELVTLVFFSYTYRINTKRRNLYLTKKNVRLGKKYQVCENLRIIRTLLPIFAIHFVFTFSNGFSLSLVPYIAPNATADWAKVYMEIMAQMPLYSVVFPLYSFIRVRMRQKVFPTNDINNADNHFANLKVLFEQTTRSE